MIDSIMFLQIQGGFWVNLHLIDVLICERHVFLNVNVSLLYRNMG